MQIYTPEEIAADYTAEGILFKAICLHMHYYKQQGGLPATITLDLQENGRALIIAYFMQLMKHGAPKNDRVPNGMKVSKAEFISYCKYEFMKLAVIIHECFSTQGYGKAERVVDEYYGYFTEVCAPFFMTGDYTGNEKWPTKFSVD